MSLSFSAFLYIISYICNINHSVFFILGNEVSLEINDNVDQKNKKRRDDIQVMSLF